jgi:hypothetical protein
MQRAIVLCYGPEQPIEEKETNPIVAIHLALVIKRPVMVVRVNGEPS